VGLATKPDFARSMERIEAWFQQSVLDRPPVRFYKHNAQFDAGEPLDRSRWPSLEARWFDVDYQVENFEQSIAGKVFHAETFPVFFPNLGPNVYSAFYGGRLEFAEVTSWFEAVVTDLDDLSPLRSDPFKNVYFKKLEQMPRAALDRSGDRYWVGYTDLHPSLDCVAAWLGIRRAFSRDGRGAGKTRADRQAFEPGFSPHLRSLRYDAQKGRAALDHMDEHSRAGQAPHSQL